ncbi:MAG: tetratricopeptide repeat protein, partial [Planctomycetota bacterium]
TEKLAESLGDESSEEEWHTLARYYEAGRRWPDATDAIAKALEKSPKSVLALGTSARIAEMSGDYTAAADLNRKLAEVDRRSRSDHLMNVARLEAQLGRTDQALQAGKDLIVSAPGNTDNYEFYAQLCFQLGKMQEGLDALRKAVRINPTEPALIMSLGSALSREFRTDEAIEVYWRAFEKTDEIDDKTSLTQKLAELYLQLNQFDKLLERFERDRREDSKRREMTICLAQAHNSAGDYGIARRELESLLSENTRDTNLLQQISKLCEQESDLDGAIEYQKQLASIAPGHETEYRLAGLLQRRGDDDEASAIFVRLTQREEDPVRLLRSIDSLLRQSSYDSVIAVTEPLLSETRDDWELLYREAVAWASMEKLAEAKDRFQRLLSLNIPHDKLGRSAAEKFKRNQARARSNNLRGIQTQMPTKQSPLQFLARSHEIRRAVGLDSDNYYVAPGTRASVWAPDVYGRARMAAFAWLMKFEDQPSTTADEEPTKEDEESPTLVDALAKKVSDESAHRNDIYDYMYVQQLKNNMDELFKMGRRLAKEGGKEEQRYFLSSLMTRHINSQTQQGRSRSANEKPAKKPLGDEDLALMLECFTSLNEGDNKKDSSLTSGGQILVSGGRTYIMIGGSYRPIESISSYNVGIVAEELRLAGKEEEADKMIDQSIEKASTSSELIAAMQLRTTQEDEEGVDALFDRWITAAKDEIAKAATQTGSTSTRRGASGSASPASSASGYIAQWMGRLGAEEENEKVLTILDKTLDVIVEEGKLARAKRSKRRRGRSTTQRYGSNFQIYYGKENNYTRLDYPSPNEYVNQAGIWLLRQAYEVVNRNEVPADLTARLKKRAEFASEKAGDSLYEQLMLGYVLWWQDEKDEAVQMIASAASQLPDDPTFRLETARLHQLLGDPDAALEVVDSIAPRDQKLVQQKELLALQLAERLGDVDRARSAAERLFGLRLDTNTQLTLVDQMRRLGMMEMGEAIMARAQRRSGTQAQALPRLMTLYQGQGKIELAEQIAHKILRRTKSPLSLMSTSSRNPFRYNRSSNAERTQALRLLQQTGAMKDLIARAERQLERSPESTRLYEQLIEYYQVSNDRKKVGAMLAKGVENKPDSIAMRYQLAKHLEQTGKVSEACDQYLAVLKRKPSWIADELYQVRRSFERAKRSLDLVNAFSEVNLKSVGSPYYLVDLVENMLRRGSSSSDEEKEIAIDFFERVFEAYPSYRNNMISNLYDEEIWKNPRIFALGKRGLIPSATQVNSNPWAGVDQVYSWSNGGTVNSMFHRVTQAVKGT